MVCVINKVTKPKRSLQLKDTYQEKMRIRNKDAQIRQILLHVTKINDYVYY